MSKRFSFHANSLRASGIEEKPAEEGETTNDSLPSSESMLLDSCQKDSVP